MSQYEEVIKEFKNNEGYLQVKEYFEILNFSINFIFYSQ